MIKFKFILFQNEKEKKWSLFEDMNIKDKTYFNEKEIKMFKNSNSIFHWIEITNL